MESLITFVFWPQPASGAQPISFCYVGAQSLHLQTLTAATRSAVAFGLKRA